MSAPAVSVIVLNYNGLKWLAPCFDALYAQQGAPPFEIVLSDNASTDGSIAFVKERYPGVRLLENATNLGFAAGNNAGARAASGRILVFLNNDTEPEPDWLARLLAPLDRDDTIGMVTSRIVSMSDRDRIDSAGDGYLWAGGAFKHGQGSLASGHLESREVFGACGAAFAIRREAFEAAGGFDEAFFIYYEDVDLSYRVRLLGYRCWYAADAVVRHAVSSTFGQLSPAAVFYGQRNLEWVWLKNTPGSLLLRSLPAHVVYSVAGLAYYARQGLLGPALRGKATALAGLPRVLSERRAVQRARKAGTSQIERLLTPRWWMVKKREKFQAG